MSKPVEIEFLMKDGLSAGIDKVGEKTDALGDKAAKTGTEYQKVQQQVMELRNVISLLEAQLNELRLAGDVASPDLDQSENIAQIEALEKQIEALEAELKRLQTVSSDTDVVPPQLPQAERKFNGLHNSIQQMAREMPSLAMGPQMFFMAISNNLPIFADEVARARKEYDDLIKTGQKGTPVWKQILSSLFSWQTALTTGIMLLVMYGDEIVEWTKDIFSAKKGVEEFTISLEEMTEIEKDGRAQMIQTRFEIDSVIASLKDFTGSKEEEKAKVEELNRKYGEAFGYYDTVAQWYDVLIQKSEDYIQMLFLQAKAQAMVNKAVEADAELQKLKQQKPGDADSDMNWFARMGHYMMQTEMAQAGQYYDAQGTIDKYNQQAYEEMIREAEAKVQGYLDEAQALTEQAANVGKNMDIGGHTKPTAPKTDPKKEVERRLALEKEQAEELRQLRWDNEQAEIDQMKDSSEKRIRQIQLDYEKAIAEIRDQEMKWREAQGGNLTEEQHTALKDAYSLAQSGMESEVRDVEADEVQKGREKLNALLEEYKTYDQRRRSIEEAYNRDMEVYNAELESLRNSGGDTSQIEASIQARTDAYKKEIQSLEADILHATDFYDKLFSDVSEKGYKVLKDFYAQAKETLDNAQVSADGVVVEVPVKDADGKFVKKAVKLTVAEFEKMKQQVVAIQHELEKKNPFAAFKTSWSDLMKAMKNGGDVTGALTNMNSKGKELTSTIRGWGDSLGAVFGDRFSQSMEEMMTMVDGVMDMGTGIAQIYSGDIVGGITNTLSGLGSIISMFTSWKEKMEEMRREWYIAEIETNRAIRERNQELAANRDTIQDIITNQELLNWLVEKGYSKPSSVSVWEAQSAALLEYQKNLEAEMRTNDALWNNLQASDAHWEWGNSLNGGSVTHSLRGMSAEQIELYYNQNKLSDAARDYYEAWVESGKSVEELKKNIEETYASMQEMVMGTSFDGFLTNVRNALRDARGDMRQFADFTEDVISEALLNAFMYQQLAKALEPLYNDLSEHLIDGTADKDYLADWKENFQNVLSSETEKLKDLGNELGVDVFSGGTSQTGKSGAFTAMNQEQGTKLEGLFVSGQMHWASIDEHAEDMSETMSIAEAHLARIEENTETCAKELKEIKEEVKKQNRDGIKVK